MDDARPNCGSQGLVVVVPLYRTLFSAAGYAVATMWSPSRPMRHALVLGEIGFVASIAGALGPSSVGPRWYAWGLVAGALPAAFSGGWFGARRRNAPSPERPK